MQYVKDLTHGSIRGSIRGQLVRLALPVMGSSFVQMAYSFTDMAWVGSLGSKSVAAIGAVGVLTWTSNSLALINKVGAEVNVSQCIGAQRMDKAQAYASHNLTLALLISVVWTTLIWTCAVVDRDIRDGKRRDAVVGGIFAGGIYGFPFYFYVCRFHRNLQCFGAYAGSFLCKWNRIGTQYAA